MFAMMQHLMWVQQQHLIFVYLCLIIYYDILLNYYSYYSRSNFQNHHS